MEGSDLDSQKMYLIGLSICKKGLSNSFTVKITRERLTKMADPFVHSQNLCFRYSYTNLFFVMYTNLAKATTAYKMKIEVKIVSKMREILNILLFITLHYFFSYTHFVNLKTLQNTFAPS